MSLLVRIREMVSAHSHHALDEIENPEVMSQQMLRELGDDLARANHALVSALGAEKHLLRQQQQARAEAAEWHARAERMLVSSGGGEALARSALERAVAAEVRASEQALPLETAGKGVRRLREQAARLKSEWENARVRCAQIAANQQAAEALGAATRFGDHYSRAMERAHRLDQLSRKSAVFDCQAEAASELLGEQEKLDGEIARIEQQIQHQRELKRRIETARAEADEALAEVMRLRAIELAGQGARVKEAARYTRQTRDKLTELNRR